MTAYNWTFCKYCSEMQNIKNWLGGMSMCGVMQLAIILSQSGDMSMCKIIMAAYNWTFCKPRWIT